MAKKSFLWDGDNILAEYGDNVAREVLYSYEPRQYGELVSDTLAESPTSSRQYHFDGIGSTIDLTDESQNSLGFTRYSAFGSITTELTAASTPFQFCGRVGYCRDDELGTFYVRRRDYNSDNGRWLSTDPLYFVVIGLETLNPYLYVVNRPLQAVDPSGKKLYAIDGTWFDYAKESNVRWIYDLAKDQGEYFRGPRMGGTGADDVLILNKVLDTICDDLCAARQNCEEFRIDLVGWSRGAIVAATVAERLNSEGCCCNPRRRWSIVPCRDRIKPVPVAWVGLFDAVSQHFLDEYRWADEFSPNIAKHSHAVKTANEFLFPTEYGFAPYKKFWRNNSDPATHGDVGARRDNNWAAYWMYGEAIAAGVDLQQTTIRLPPLWNTGPVLVQPQE